MYRSSFLRFGSFYNDVNVCFVCCLSIIAMAYGSSVPVIPPPYVHYHDHTTTTTSTVVFHVTVRSLLQIHSVHFDILYL